mmetsp:Transcript_39741/g.93039  ORF Transcript_39741/g.93039 Transcript_39741/m.93039 type:complete len:80 (+) Transcript_39741:280-519(+)
MSSDKVEELYLGSVLSRVREGLAKLQTDLMMMTGIGEENEVGNGKFAVNVMGVTEVGVLEAFHMRKADTVSRMRVLWKV